MRELLRTGAGPGHAVPGVGVGLVQNNTDRSVEFDILKYP